MSIRRPDSAATTLPNWDATTSSTELVREWLMHERRAELGFETHRFSDLRRWRIAEEVLRTMGKNFRQNHYLYPVPQREIDRSGGTITKNAGY